MLVLLTSQAQKRSYDDAFKLKVVEDAEKTTSRAAARKFKLDHGVYMHTVIML